MSPKVTLLECIKSLLHTQTQVLELALESSSIPELYRELQNPPEIVSRDEQEIMEHYGLEESHSPSQFSLPMYEQLEGIFQTSTLPDSLKELLWGYPFYRSVIELPCLPDETIVLKKNVFVNDAIAYSFVWAEYLFQQLPQTIKHKEQIFMLWKNFSLGTQSEGC